MIVRLLILSSFIYFLLITGSCHAFPDRVERDIVAEEGLYGGDTKVISLNASTFDSIYGTDNSWLVEFYSSWCGHCQRFAPLWKDLAEDVYGWRDVIKIAAIDCAAEFNNPHCRDYHISAYPSLRFYSAKASRTNKGLDVTKRKTILELRHTIVYMLVREQNEGRGSTWPKITPYRSETAESLWSDVPDSVKYQIIVYENENSYLGPELILDLNIIPGVRVKRIVYETSGLNEDAIQNTTSPSLVVLQRDTENQPLDAGRPTREAFLATVRGYLGSKNISMISEGTEHTAPAMHGNSVDTTQYRSDVLYQVDLENALRYSLKHEITVQNQIMGESLDALKNYLKVLVKYFPTTNTGTRFLEQLRDWVINREETTGTDFLNRVQELENQYQPVFQSDEEWLGCKGSEIRYRGYPCGLWTLFHTLTTNAVLQNSNAVNVNSLEVLDTMVGYIKNFFGCLECSQHFQEMARESLHGNVSQPNDGIIWLWRAHNSVNKRLSGDVTEDPSHPKIQFPSAVSCPTCRDNNGEWNDSQALLFLKQMYGKYNIDYTRWKGTRNTEFNSRETPERLPVAESLASRSSTMTIPFLSSALVLGALVVYATS